MKIDISKGRYWDKAWSLVDGCTPCSPGCDHCWSAAMTTRFEKKPVKIEPGAELYEHFFIHNGKFNGNIKTHPDLDIPGKRRKPTVFAVWNDLMHENVKTAFIEQALTIMWKAEKHTFLILTKRPERFNVVSRLGHWPYDNVYLGLTVCTQKEADEKIPVFLKVPGKKFLSIEPMLGAIDMSDTLSLSCERCQSCGRLYREVWSADDSSWARVVDKYGGGLRCPDCFESEAKATGVHYKITISGTIPTVDAVILGGETGAGARPLHPDWARSVRDQCAAAGVDFFFKQWGEWLWQYEARVIDINGNVLKRDQTDIRYNYAYLSDGKVMTRVGRKKAGRVLDGRTHDDLAWRKE